jgi:hypothetical protein
LCVATSSTCFDRCSGRLIGRILVHGEEEASGRSYLMLEGTNGQVYHIYRTPEMEELRSQRGLQTNSFIRLRKFGTVVEIQDMGDSEAILRNKAHLRETAREMIRRKPCLTAHSRMKSGKRKNASDARAAASAANVN